jgi:hypothetical protein
MQIHIHIHHHGKNGEDELLQNIFTLTQLIHEQNKKIIMTNEELVQGLQDATGQLVKVKGETSATLQKVTDLENALNNQGNVSPQVEEAFNALKAQVQVVDDLIADAPTAPIEPPVEGENGGTV